jgi:hypothetical protein
VSARSQAAFLDREAAVARRRLARRRGAVAVNGTTIGGAAEAGAARGLGKLAGSSATPIPPP